MASDSSLPARAWLVVGLLWVAACLNYLDRIMLVTMRTSIKDAIHMTDAQFGMLSTLFLVVYAGLSPLGGFVADRWGQTRVIVLSLFAWSASSWLTAQATTLEGLLACRVLMAISEAAYIPAAASLIMDYHRGRTRSLANGIHLSGFMVGSGLGGLGGWLSEGHGWSFAFEWFGAGGIAFALVMAALLRDRPEEARPAMRDQADRSPVRLVDALRSLFGSRSFVVALVFWGLLGVASWAFVGWMPTYVGERFHLAQGRAGFVSMGCIYGGSLVGMIAGGAWADRWRRAGNRAPVWVGVIGIVVTIPCVLLAANTGQLAVVVAALAIYGVVRAFPDANMMPILCQIVDAPYRATAMGLLNGFASLIGGGVIYAGGALRDANVNVRIVFDIGAAGLLVCAILLWLIRPPVRASPIPKSAVTVDCA